MKKHQSTEKAYIKIHQLFEKQALKKIKKCLTNKKRCVKIYRLSQKRQQIKNEH
jgi:hypothetical protein